MKYTLYVTLFDKIDSKCEHMTHCIHTNGESNTIKLSHANEHIRRYDIYGWCMG